MTPDCSFLRFFLATLQSTLQALCSATFFAPGRRLIAAMAALTRVIKTANQATGVGRVLIKNTARPASRIHPKITASVMAGVVTGLILRATSTFAAVASATTTAATETAAADSLALIPGWALSLYNNPMTMSLLEALWQTIYMVGLSSFYSLVIGFFIAMFMVMTGPHGLHPMPKLYRMFDFSVNIFRSLPFIILIIAIMPLTRFVMGTTIGTESTILPLTIAAAPFAARLIEGSFLEVDKGVVEAARSFGASDWQIIMRVMLPEALPAIVLNVAVLAITLLSYSAMAGTVGGGGLGDLAFRYGYQRFQTEFTVWSVVLLIILVQIIQTLGNLCYARLRSTKRAEQTASAE